MLVCHLGLLKQYYMLNDVVKTMLGLTQGS